MTKYIALLITGCFLLVCAKAQQPVKKAANVSFRTIFQAGILEGQSDKTAAQLQLVNGLKIHSWFAGIGAGIDYYGAKRSVPLFLSVQKELRANKKTPFAYGDAGYNFSWLRDKEKVLSVGEYKQSGGFFYEFGLGYKFILKNKMYLGLSAGYSYKQQTERLVSPQFCDFCVPRPVPPVEEYEYTFKRVSIKMNCWF